MSTGISCMIPELKGEARTFHHVMAVDPDVTSPPRKLVCLENISWPKCLFAPPALPHLEAGLSATMCVEAIGEKCGTHHPYLSPALPFRETMCLAPCLPMSLRKPHGWMDEKKRHLGCLILIQTHIVSPWLALLAVLPMGKSFSVFLVLLLSFAEFLESAPITAASLRRRCKLRTKPDTKSQDGQAPKPLQISSLGFVNFIISAISDLHTHFSIKSLSTRNPCSRQGNISQVHFVIFLH